MKPEITINKNLKRRQFVNKDLRFYKKKYPLPTWIEISLIDTCNRKCSFCPKSVPAIAPDTHNKISIELIEKLASELKNLKYKGSIALCGYGEPMLHKNIYLITKILSSVSSVEIITNGDALTKKNIQKLYNAGVHRIVISLYDGFHQVKKFKSLIKRSNVPKGIFILRDRWYKKDLNFGVKLTNRAGTVKIGNQIKVGVHDLCYYPSYQLMLDWNGNTYLCPQDWQRKKSLGDLNNEKLIDIWIGEKFNYYRKKLLKGNRDKEPCLSCNANGTLLGFNHSNIWKKIYK